MKATEAKLLDFLKKSPQFIIPIYQRTYSWTESQCRQLCEDILRAGGNDEITAHFVGSIVYIEKGLYQVSSQSPLLVIDGQQRLTTVSLIVEALHAILETPNHSTGFPPRNSGATTCLIRWKTTNVATSCCSPRPISKACYQSWTRSRCPPSTPCV